MPLEISSWDDVMGFAKKEGDYVEIACVDLYCGREKKVRSLGRWL